MLETFRECLRDVFDLAGLKEILQGVAQRKIRIHQVETSSASPFASSVLFTYTGNFLYNGDAPLAERRAATLALDHAQLRELLGDAELRQLLDASVIDELALELQRMNAKFPIRDADGIHDLLRWVGDLTQTELLARNFAEGFHVNQAIQDLVGSRRIVELPIGGQLRVIAAEDAGRYRDAFGVVPPPGLPDAFLENVPKALMDIIARYARTHVPFSADDVAKRFAIGAPMVRATLATLQSADRVLEGEFLPGGRGREWTDVEVLRKLKQRSLAKLRKQIEPVEPSRWATFITRWQGLNKPRRGLDGCLDVIEQLQGLPLPFSELERSLLPSRVVDYKPGQLDELCAAGEIVWRGMSTIGTHDARIALYLTDSAPLLCPLPEPWETSSDSSQDAPSREQQIFALLQAQGALFFDALVRATGGFREELLSAIWQLVWSGHLTNDTLAPLRSLFQQSSAKKKTQRRRRASFRSRRAQQLPGSEGRWTVRAFSTARPTGGCITNRAADRHGESTD